MRECFEAHQGRRIDKWSHYLEIYERHFAKYVGTAVRVLEIGVDHGGSLQLWQDYFGPNSEIVGIDIDPNCGDEGYVGPGIQVYILDQSKIIPGQLGQFDLVVDDGSHLKSDQEASFKALWPSTRGVYLIEDCHSGYPEIAAPGALAFAYPWVLVLEKAERLIRGTPSRPLREDEIEAQRLYSDL